MNIVSVYFFHSVYLPVTAIDRMARTPAAG
jgi:hypothetical protein